MVQLSHLYMNAGKTIALAIWTFVSKVMPLLFNTLSRFVNSRFLCNIVLYSIGLHKKDLNDPDNNDGVITPLEPDILECEVRCTLGSITRTKLVEVMEFQRSDFKSSKMMLLKCCTHYASKFEKLSSGYRTGKGQFSFQSQRKAMPKNVQTTVQMHSFHMLSR